MSGDKRTLFSGFAFSFLKTAFLSEKFSDAMEENVESSPEEGSKEEFDSIQLLAKGKIQGRERQTENREGTIFTIYRSDELQVLGGCASLSPFDGSTEFPALTIVPSQAAAPG